MLDLSSGAKGASSDPFVNTIFGDGVDGGDTITLTGVHKAGLAATDFVIA